MEPAPSPKPRPRAKILAAQRYIFSVNALKFSYTFPKLSAISMALRMAMDLFTVS